MSSTLPAPVQGYIDASNAFDGDALIDWFADDALVTDTRREFWGKQAIRAWLDREIIGDKVTTDPSAAPDDPFRILFRSSSQATTGTSSSTP